MRPRLAAWDEGVRLLFFSAAAAACLYVAVYSFGVFPAVTTSPSGSVARVPSVRLPHVTTQVLKWRVKHHDTRGRTPQAVAARRRTPAPTTRTVMPKPIAPRTHTAVPSKVPTAPSPRAPQLPSAPVANVASLSAMAAPQMPAPADATTAFPISASELPQLPALPPLPQLPGK